jgi:glucokinase
MRENMSQTKNLVGLEVKNTEVLAVCVGDKGGIIDSFRFPLTSDGELSAQIIRAINKAKEKFEDFEKIGIALPGLLNLKTKQIAFSTRIPEIVEYDILSEIENATGLPVTIQNDANAAAFAEHVYGAGKGSKNLFYATVGAGIGGALILDDKLWLGESGFAGEFGHIAINSEGMKLEDLASTGNILRRTRNWLHKDSASSLNVIGEENITITDVVEAANHEDDFAQLMLERTGAYIGTAIAGVINLLNIKKIVIGGEIMQAEEIVLDAIVQRAKELSFMPSFESTTISAGTLGENASAIGVALLSDKSGG